MIAKQDIECFKIFNYDSESNVIESPFRRVSFELKTPMPTVEIGKHWRTITTGYHAFQSYQEMYDYVDSGSYAYDVWWPTDNIKDINVLLTKCIIPNGSVYYTGKHGISNIRNIVSNNLVVESVISRHPIISCDDIFFGDTIHFPMLHQHLSVEEIK